MTIETLGLYRYTIVEERRSKIDPDATYKIEVGVRCPKCKSVGPTIEHGETRKCRNCGLYMTVYGAAIQCEIK